MTSVLFEQLDIHKARPIKWLWQDRFVESALNLIVGNEGVGKGNLVAWVLAQLTKGKLNRSPWEKPCNVAIVGHEDSFDHVWGPRLWAAGANTKRVGRIRRGDVDQIEITRDVQELADVIASKKVKAIYFDQFLDNLPVDTDHYNTKQVRAALAPLKTLAEALEVTVIATLHPNKRAESFRQLVNGSSAFNAVARSSLLVADHPDREDTRVLLTGKSNYGIRGKAVEFKIVEDHIRPNGRLLKTSRVVMGEKSDITIQDLVGAKSPHASEHKGIEGVLREALADGEWHEVQELMSDAAFDGMSNRGVRAAATRLGVDRKRGEFQGAVQWRLRTEGS